MPRVKSNVARLKRKNKVMKLAKGYWGGRSKLWKAAKEATSTPTATAAPKRSSSGASGSRASTPRPGCTRCRTTSS